MGCHPTKCTSVTTSLTPPSAKEQLDSPQPQSDKPCFTCLRILCMNITFASKASLTKYCTYYYIIHKLLYVLFFREREREILQFVHM